MMWKAVLSVLAAVFVVGSVSTMVGGLADADPNEEGVQNALRVAVAEHNKRSNDVFLTQVSEVVRVQRQVVSGINYMITVRLARTPCRKDNPSEVCEIHQDPEQARPYLCTFTVWSRPWLSDIRLIKEKC